MKLQVRYTLDPQERRFSLDELRSKAGIASARAMRHRLNLRHDQYEHHLAEGLSWWDADHYACRLGFHPLEVWGLSWHEARAACLDRTPVQLDLWGMGDSAP